MKIALCGKAGSGKDTVLAIMKKLLPQNLVICEDRFALPVKTCIAGFLGDTVENLNKSVIKHRELPSTWFTEDSHNKHLTIRDLHTIIGDALKGTFGPDIFATSLIERAEKFKGDHFFVVDLRFPNEAAVLRLNGFQLIKINRNACEVVNHSSEQYIDSIEADHILNNNGSIEELEYKVKELMYELNLIS